MEEVVAVLRHRSLTGLDNVALAEQAFEAAQAILRVHAREGVRISLTGCLDGTDLIYITSTPSDAIGVVLIGALAVATELAIAQRDGLEAASAGPDTNGH